MKFWFLLLLLLMTGFLNAQNSTRVSGIVIDKSTSEPLFGVTVQIKGTNAGAVTDFDGKYNISIPASSDTSPTLVFKALGYETKEVLVDNQAIVNVSLLEDIESLDAVVVTSSYGTKKRREEVVGSISSIKPRELATEQPATSVDELLEGQVAGVLINSNVNLGEPVSIDIRGQGSLTPLDGNVSGTSTQPLIIVDGIILTEELGIEGNNFFDADTGRFSENFLNPLARVGIQDIESIEILKDAAAVGLYGADAANGVILITTKSARPGKLRLNASIQGGRTTAFDQIQYMNGEQFNELRNIYNINNGDFGAVRPYNGVDTDWFGLLNDDGTFSRYSLGGNIGGEIVRFRGSVTYQNRQEAQVNNSFEQWNTSFTTNIVTDKFNAAIKLSPSWVTKNNPNTLGSFPLDPTLPVRDENGNLTLLPNIGNPIAVAQQNVSEANTFALLGNINLNYKFNNRFNITMLYGTDFSNKEEDKFFSGLNGSGITNNGEFGRRILRERNNRSWNWSTTASYEQSFNDIHNVSAIAGIETRGEVVELSYIAGTDFENFATPQPIESAAEIDRETDTNERYGRSGYTQISYDFDKTYFALINFRVDQSSAFGDDNNTAFNGGAGVSWVLSNEKFLKDADFTDFLRLRVSYGTTGNSRIGSYAALGLYDINNGGYNQTDRRASPQGTAPNPNLGWEKNNKFNIGLDYNFAQRFRATLEFFNDRIDDIITTRPALPETGYTNIEINGSSMRNRGIEFSIEAQWFNNENFSWTTNFNAASLDNEILSLSGASSEFSAAATARAQQVGSPTTALFGYESIGIDPATGRELFRVDGNIYDSNEVRELFDITDAQIIGDTQPDFYGGMRNTLSYKSFQLAIINSFTYGGDIRLDRNLIDGYNVLTNRNLNLNVFFDAWRQPGDLAANPAPTNSNSLVNSSRYVYDGSNIQLKSITLSYTAPVDKWKLPVNSLSFNINGSNLYYWYSDGRQSGRNSIAELSNVYPQQRTISIGLNTTF
ncbi:SusC/RagA family TonB-linked outer membrane protein [Nonlabens ponticola]|uniref:SusC/RagA family TonB-linked outer membrane protein n=1 Tax=Nonlabens ponticola TaxID=2496866 RepID=A0A3S9MXJ1_9FLAO|nr:SusC/RagA family TonB-linked outer membrane protein [Nonlabens ponticola]AZQ43961.1 SusC/RagA family TonB-linked outer membrane protein [Nonlabens ponticola]